MRVGDGGWVRVGDEVGDGGWVRVGDGISSCFFFIVFVYFPSFFLPRFRILKNPINFHEQITMDNIMKTCCMLHNIILKFDNPEWENVDWAKLDPMRQGIEIRLFILKCVRNPMSDYYSPQMMQTRMT